MEPGIPESGIDGNSSGIPFSKMAFSGNSDHAGEVYWLYKGIFIYRVVLFIYREVPLHCATKYP